MHVLYLCPIVHPKGSLMRHIIKPITRSACNAKLRDHNSSFAYAFLKFFLFDYLKLRLLICLYETIPSQLPKFLIDGRHFSRLNRKIFMLSPCISRCASPAKYAFLVGGARYSTRLLMTLQSFP